MPDLVFATKGQAAVLRAQDDMRRRAEDLRKEMKAQGVEADKARAAILKIYESTKTPHEQMKQRMGVLRKAIKDGVAPQEASIALERLQAKHKEMTESAGKDLKKLKATNESTFSENVISRWGLALKAGITAAVIASFKTIADERRKLAEDDKAAIAGEGQLAQFANSEAEMNALLAESRAAYAMGVGRDRKTAAAALAGMLGADISDPQDRLTLMRMQASGIVPDAGSLAVAAKTLQSSFGGGLVGYIDRSFGAGDIAPGGASELLIAAARSGQGARTLGLSPDEVIGATAALSQATGNEGEGATQLAALLKSLDKAGGFAGKTLAAAVAEIRNRTAGGEDIRKILGDRIEAINAYRYLASDIGGATYQRALAGSTQGAGSQSAMAKLALAEYADPNLASARFNIVQQQSRAIRQLEEAAFTNIAAGVQEIEIARTQNLPSSLQPFARAALGGAHWLQSWRDPEAVAREHANDPLYMNTPVNTEARKLIDNIERQRDIQEQQLRILREINNKSNEGGLLIGGD